MVGLMKFYFFLFFHLLISPAISGGKAQLSKQIGPGRLGGGGLCHWPDSLPGNLPHQDRPTLPSATPAPISHGACPAQKGQGHFLWVLSRGKGDEHWLFLSLMPSTAPEHAVHQHTPPEEGLAAAVSTPAGSGSCAPDLLHSVTLFSWLFLARSPIWNSSLFYLAREERSPLGWGAWCLGRVLGPGG